MSEFFKAGEDVPPLTGYIDIYGEEGSGKTTLACSYSDHWKTPGAKLVDGLLLAWDRGAHDSIRSAGHSMDMVDMDMALGKVGLVSILNNFEKLFPESVKKSPPRFVVHSSMTPLDREVGRVAGEKFADDTQRMWSYYAELLVFYYAVVRKMFPKALHIYEFHAKAALEAQGSRAANDKLKREAEGIMPIMPDITGKGAAMFTRSASLTLFTDILRGPDGVKFLAFTESSGKFKAKSRFGKKLPAKLEGESLDLKWVEKAIST